MTVPYSKNLPTTHCYVRTTSFGKIGSHRIAALAFAPIAGDSTKVRVAWSLCSHKDNFNRNFARKSAIGRLNSNSTSKVVDRNSNSVIVECGIVEALHKFRSPNERFELDDAIKGALFDLAESAPLVSMSDAKG
jgi:hypothetical protein